MKTRIKELRREHGFTQEFLAYKLGTTQASLSRIECELSTPDAALLVNLSNIFQVSTDYILYLSDQKKRVCHSLCCPQNSQRITHSLPKFNPRQCAYLQNFLKSLLYR